MRTRRLLCFCLALLAVGSIETQAQGLGGLLKKAKKGLEAVTGQKQATTQTSSLKTKGTETPIEGGGTIINPLPGIVDIQLVGAYGKTISENYGEVRLGFKVKMIANLTTMRFGCNVNLPALMVDQDGNTYKSRESAGWYNYDVTEGVWMNMPLKETAAFVDVKKSATTIQRLQYGVSTSYQDSGLIILKNVPIQWDVEPK